MGITYNPRTITDGIILALDAGNSKSYDNTENLMTNSQLGTTILNDGGGVTLTTDTTITNPFGGSDGVLRCVHTTNTPGYFRRGQSISLTAGVTYTFSVFFKNGTVSNPYGQISPTPGPSVLANTFSPSFQELGQSLNTNINVGNGWYRQVFTFTPTYTQTYNVVFNQSVGQTLLGTYYLYGFQLERGSSANPYYATTASAKNRGTTLIDMTGRGNSGTLVNGTRYNSGNLGSLVFDGTNDYVSIPLSTSLNKTQGTMNFWVYPTRYNGSNGYFVNRDDSTANAVDWLWIGPYSDTFYFRLGNGSDCCSNDLTFSSVSSVIPLNSWTNMCFTWVSNGTSAIYKNGTLYTSRSIGNVPSTNPSSIGRIGLGHGGNGDEYFAGRISNTSIYNRALTASEIQQNYNALKSRYI